MWNTYFGITSMYTNVLKDTKLNLTCLRIRRLQQISSNWTKTKIRYNIFWVFFPAPKIFLPSIDQFDTLSIRQKRTRACLRNGNNLLSEHLLSNLNVNAVRHKNHSGCIGLLASNTLCSLFDISPNVHVYSRFFWKERERDR